MADYAIGDVHACRPALEALLERLRFDPAQDHLWFTGDLVGRGPEPVATLRLLRSLGSAVESVLGNHDLHCLAVAAGAGKPRDDDGLDALWQAHDRDQLIEWLRQRPLMHECSGLGYSLVHAGIPPQWGIDAALGYAAEAQAIIRSTTLPALLANLYGNQPDRWDDQLNGWERLRFIINAFTRMRFCHADGRLDFGCNDAPERAPDHLYPWYAAPGNHLDGNRTTLVTGHWSRLGQRQGPGYITLDTGCLWGGQLTAVRLDCATPEFTVLDCTMHRHPS